MLPKLVWKQHMLKLCGNVFAMHAVFPGNLPYLPSYSVHPTWTEWQLLEISKYTLGGGKEGNCVCPLTTQLGWICHEIPADRLDVVLLKAEKCLDLWRFLPQRPLQICMVYKVINIRHIGYNGIRGKQKREPSVQVLISGYFESP